MHKSQRQFRPEYWHIPTIVSDHPKIQAFDEKVYAVIHWYYYMKEGKCWASNNTIAHAIKPTDPQIRSVQNSLNHLEDYGFIKRIFKDKNKRHRKEIIPLVAYHLKKPERTTDDTNSQNELGSVLERTTDDSQNEPQMTRTIIVSNKELNSNTASQSDAGHERSKFNPQGAEIIKAFEEVNKACKRYYGNKTQRASCDRIIETHGLEKVLKVVAILPKTNKIPYMPTITTPYQLEERWSALEAAMIRKKGEFETQRQKYKVAFT